MVEAEEEEGIVAAAAVEVVGAISPVVGDFLWRGRWRLSLSTPNPVLALTKKALNFLNIFLQDSELCLYLCLVSPRTVSPGRKG